MTARTLQRLLTAAAITLTASVALAQYPTRPVTLVVPFPTGTSTDLIARILATGMSKSMGQPVVVQNRPGGNSAIGASAVANAPGDGYTLLIASAGTVALPALVKSVPFDVERDFTPIALLSRFALFLYVHPDLPVRTLPELFDYARANPGKLNFGTGNPVGITASVQMLQLAGDLSMVHVPYKGEPAAILDVASNRIQWMFSTPSSAEALAKTGRIRVIATNLPRRAPFAPDVPSVNEYLPTFGVTAWAGLMGPRGLPKDIVDRLAKEVAGAFSQREAQEKFEQLQFLGGHGTPEEFAAFFREQIQLYARVLKQAGVQPE